MRYIGDRVKSGYNLKVGNRPSGPGGSYDGTDNEDFVLVGGSGRLHPRNVGLLNGGFVYFVTDC
jgi:hypothetical protein